MNKQFLLMFSPVVFAFLITACQSTQPARNYWTVTAIQGGQEIKFTDSAIIKSLNASWLKKQKVIVKMMPRFSYEISIYEGGTVVQWLYSNSGYLIIKGSKEKIVYKVDLAILNQLINKESIN